MKHAHRANASPSLILLAHSHWSQFAPRLRVLRAVLVALLVGCIVVSDTHVPGAELSLPEIEEAIGNFKTAHGRAISEADVWEILSQSQTDIPVAKYRALWSLVREQQTPRISLEQLLRLVKTKRDSIRTVDVRMNVNRVYFTKEGDVLEDRVWKQTDHFILSGNKAFCETERETLGTEVPSATYRAAYDGVKMRTVHRPDSEQPNTTISAERSSAMLVPSPNALSVAMLLDSQTSLGMSLPQHDLALFIELCRPTLYEDTVTIDQTDCMILEDGSRYRVFLDPARNFSVIRVEWYLQDVEDSMVRVTAPRSLQKVFELKGLREYGNGIFLPQEMVSTYYFDGKKKVVATVTTNSLVINSPIEDEVFSGIVPQDALVADYTQGGAVYKQSDSASIGGLLKESVKPKRTSVLRTISIAVGLLLIAIVVLRQLLTRRRGA